MTYIERNSILNNENFIGQCQIALCDWVNYWAVNGTESIEDENLKNLTNTFIKSYIKNPYAFARKIATLAISESIIQEAEEITDLKVKEAVDHLLATTLNFILS